MTLHEDKVITLCIPLCSCVRLHVRDMGFLIFGSEMIFYYFPSFFVILKIFIIIELLYCVTIFLQATSYKLSREEVP